jgi:formylglycine-generating enzyme required for sulfatase activity
MKNLIIFFIAGIASALATGCGTQQPSAPQSAGLAVNVLVRPEAASKASEMPAQKAVDLGGGTRLEMVLIPAGSYLMGDNMGLDDEKPVHKVTITKPFYLGQYEVTVEQFRRFVEATGYATDAEKGTGFQGAFGWNRDTMEFKMNEDYSWQST